MYGNDGIIPVQGWLFTNHFAFRRSGGINKAYNPQNSWV